MTATSATTASETTTSETPDALELSRETLEHAIEHATHLLPSQGPIDVFVHHNTLHAFEDDTFEDAVVKAGRVFDCEPFLSEPAYRAALASGRITDDDLSAVLLDDLSHDSAGRDTPDRGDELIGFAGTRHALRMAMLAHPVTSPTLQELEWLLGETDSLDRFHLVADKSLSAATIEETRRKVIDLRKDGPSGHCFAELISDAPRRLQRTLDGRDHDWEAVTVHLLWKACLAGVRKTDPVDTANARTTRHRDVVLSALSVDSDTIVHREVIRFTAGYLDQGFREWNLPDHDASYFEAFLAAWSDEFAVEPWQGEMKELIASVRARGGDAIDSVLQSLESLGVSASERESFITQTLLALRGWAGMVWQMETNAEWTVRPAKPGTLVGFLAARLLLERAVLATIVREQELRSDLATLRSNLSAGTIAKPRATECRAYQLFQLAQALGWTPYDLARQTPREWRRLVQEVEAFDEMARRCVFHLAYERNFTVRTLDAIAAHKPIEQANGRPTFQLVSCIDDREESFRRAIEELEPNCETFGFAGFFGVATYFRGHDEAFFRPLCPVNVKPQHYLTEEPAFSLREASLRKLQTRRTVGDALRRVHFGTRSLVLGSLAGMLGTLATAPLVFRVLFPRLAARLSRRVRRLVMPPVTELTYERVDHDHDETACGDHSPAPAPNHGYTVEEMTAIVGNMLRSIGLTDNFAPLVLIAGHGSSSVNNPHAAAYDCGACGGGKGGPNARAFAGMANDHRIRARLRNEGLSIPDDTTFVGCYHNTSDDSITYYDLDAIPVALRERFLAIRGTLEQARRVNALERCRRFMSAPLNLSPLEALRHVEGRSEDLSQARAECGHATNAICIVGRRERTRGLFLDRRAFLTSYDPTQDTAEAATLARLLAAVIPVCAGINLEYYFSHIDPAGYGCGTKLPHNMTSLLGVMDGAESDLRTGLPWQMVEIHEPVRILFVLETSVDQFLGIMAGNPTIDRLVRNRWVQVAILSPDSTDLWLFCNGAFQPYSPADEGLPTAATSTDWFRGERGHLEFCTIDSRTESQPSTKSFSTSAGDQHLKGANA